MLGNALLSHVFGVITRPKFRVLAYHGMSNLEAFRIQMDWLVKHYEPVTLADVVAASRGDTKLSSKATWLTFDDGDPAVVEYGQPILDQLGIRATLFICPGLVGTSSCFWWQILDQAFATSRTITIGRRNWTLPMLTAKLKAVSDPRRREMIDEVGAWLEANTGRIQASRQLTLEDLRGWIAGGHSLGNHTWDHPCLDRCDRDQQTEQIVRADEWLTEFGVGAIRAFAYPNGNWTAIAETILSDLGYDIAVLFDHRLAPRRPPALRVSRLRVSVDAPLHRFRGIVSGAHSTGFALRHGNIRPWRTG